MAAIFRVPAIGERSGRFLIAVLLFVKLVLLVWNAYAYDGRTYNEGHHGDRAVFAGLAPSELAYDPPLYYLPLKFAPRPEGVPQLERHASTADDDAPRPRRARVSKAEKAYRAHLVDLLRYSNVLWIGFFYLGWIGYAFPHLLGRGPRWFLASLLLLTLPGYQKLAAMSHPENVFAATSTLAVCGWLALRKRWRPVTEPAPPPDLAPTNGRHDLWLAAFVLSIGLLALTRPIAVVPVAVFTFVAIVYAARFAAQGAKRFVPRAGLIVLAVLVLAGSWHVLRWQRTGAVARFMSDEAAAEASARRAGFDYVRYFGSFRPLALLETPNTNMGEQPPPGSVAASADSFPTLLYSEVWGDHWLSFSGPKNKERKTWPKRIILSTALLLPALLALLGGLWLFDAVKRAKGAWLATAAGAFGRAKALCAALEVELVLFCWLVIGAALFVYWQAGPALLPGDQQSVKFIHVSTLFPPAIALLFSRPLSPMRTTLLAGYLLVLYCAAFPVAMYYPS